MSIAPACIEKNGKPRRMMLKEQADDLKPAPAWKADAVRALDELKDSKLYFLPTAKKMAAHGSPAQAIAQLNVGLKALPGPF